MTCLTDVPGLQVQQKFEAAIETEDVQQRIKERLFQERARLERDVEAKIAEERRLQLLRKRKDQEQRLKEQARALRRLLCVARRYL